MQISGGDEFKLQTMGKGLKAALKSQQSRLKQKEKIQKAAHAAELKGKKNPGNEKLKGNLPPNRQPTIPFLPHDKILLIGEGNFSFARALVIHPPAILESLPPENITASAYDSEEECYAKYPNAREIVGVLKTKGVEVLFGVDATKLEKNPSLKGRKWDRVVWNFPHAGKGITDQDRNILSNQVLILDFLRSAANVLKAGPIPTFAKSSKKKVDEDEMDAMASLNDAPPEISSGGARGTILITLRNVVPYTLWDVPRLAKKPPPPKSGSRSPNPSYIQLRSFVFHRDLWTGYEHRMTKGEHAHGAGKTGEGGEDRTWEFCLRD